MLNNNSLIDDAKGVFTNSDWIQPSIARSYLTPGNDKIIDGIYAATVNEEIVINTGSNEAWFWSAQWQALENEADQDIAQGRFTTHNSMDDFIADLDS